MQITSTKKSLSLILVLALCSVFLSWCTNWQKKYDALNVEHQNLKGLFERERAEKSQLAEKAAQDKMTIEELQKKIAEQQSTAQASGFGQGYDVSFDASAGTITVTLQDSILFSSGKAELKSTSNAQLNHIRSVLQAKYQGKQIDVVGHTDSDPIKKSKWKDNWELSAQRALTVVRYLVAQGMSDANLRAVGCGSARPVTSNATNSGKAQNRRVEIVVYMK